MRNLRKVLAVLPLFLTLSCGARTLVVGTGGGYASVRSALDDCCDGDTVVVRSGFYQEGNLRIRRRIVFLGEGMPVLDGGKKYEVLTIESDSVKVTGFRVQNSGRSALDDPGGIRIRSCRRVEISGNELESNFFGIYVEYGSGCVLRENRIHATATGEQDIGNAIHCWKSDSLQIIGNRISGHRDGIYFEFVTHSVIWRNISENNIRYGMHFMFSHNDTYVGNLFRRNGAGVAVMFTHHVTMLHNTFCDNWGDAAYGLLLKEISDSHIEGNTFQRNTSGIFMEGTNRIQVVRNRFDQNGWGMKIQASCMDNRITDNNFTGNTFDVSTNGSIVLNHFQHNYWDKYEGYDLGHDGFGDVAFHPLSMYSMIVENNNSAMLLYRSLIVTLLDKSEKIFPTLTPDQFADPEPRMKALKL